MVVFLILGLVWVSKTCHDYDYNCFIKILLSRVYTLFCYFKYKTTQFLLVLFQMYNLNQGMSLYYPQGGQISKARSNSQSLLSVYLQSLVYYDQIYSYFAIIFQYLIFIYKYNILFYNSSTIAGEMILLTLLLPINSVRIYSARAGNKGKKYSFLTLFLVLDILVVIGTIYIIVLQTNALYLEVIISIIELVLSSINFVMAIILMIMYRASQ